MAEPSSDSVDIDSSAKQMGGGCMADGMRADPFLAHLRHATHGGTRISQHDLMDAEACQWHRTTIEEHSFRVTLLGDEVSQRSGCGRPEWTDANLAALAVKAHRRQRTVCSAVQAQIFDAQLGRFVRPRS